MRLALVGPGIMSIPPKGWGAVETLIWDYKCHLERMFADAITIKIINTPNIHEIVAETNAFVPDVVHIHYDVFWFIPQMLHCKKVVMTSHYGLIEQPQKWFADYHRIFQGFLHSSALIHCLSPGIASIYVQNGCDPSRIVTLPNGVDDEPFRFSATPKHCDRSIYLGKIETRKRQYIYQDIESLDFVGNYQDSCFRTSNANYRGHWTREEVHEHLTDYANMVLLSDGEAHALVCAEALIAGLGLVVSEAAAANLDIGLPFITVIPADKMNDIEFVSKEIEKNRAVSISMREKIREYGLSVFSYKCVVAKYYNILKEYISS